MGFIDKIIYAIDTFIYGLITFDSKVWMTLSIIMSILLSIAIMWTFIEFTTGKKIIKKSLIQINSANEKREIRKQQKRKFIKRIYTNIEIFKRKFGLIFRTRNREEDINHILERCSIPSIEEHKVMEIDEFDAILTIWSVVVVIVGTIIGIKVGVAIIGFTCIISGLILVNVGVLWSLRQKVKLENYIITEEFGDFYMVQYHVLMSDTQKPLEKGLKMYERLAESNAMRKFINLGLYYIKRSEGELKAIEELKSLYKDISSIQKLLGIEKQKEEGADIKDDAEGQKRLVLEEKERYIEKRGDSIKFWSGITMKLLFIIIFQMIAGASFIVINIIKYS